MALTNRERNIMFIAVAVVILLLADKYVVSPITQAYSQTKQDKVQLQAELQKSLSAIKRKNVIQKQLEQMHALGLGSDFSQAESNILRYIKESSVKNSVEISSVQPEHISVDKNIEEIEFVISGSGSMGAITKFLWDMETAELPIKLKTLQLGSNDESASRMLLQIKLSSIFVASEVGKEGEG